MKNSILVLSVLIVVTFFWSAAAQAQYASFPCPNGPGPGERVIGQQGGNGVLMCGYTGEAQPQQQQQQQQAPQAPPPRPTYSTDSYYAVVTHPDINDVWASDSFLKQDDAKQNAMDNCTQTMGSGCSVMLSGVNEYVIVYAVNDASWKWTVSTSPNDPWQMIRQCFAENKRCQTAKLVDSRKMITYVGEQLTDFKRSNHPGRYAIEDVRHKYGAIAWTGPGTTNAKKIWISNGHKSRADAENAAWNLCKKAQKDEDIMCRSAISTANGVLIVWTDKQKNVSFDSDVKLPFEWSSYDKKCKAKDPNCTLKVLIDVRDSGEFEKIIL